MFVHGAKKWWKSVVLRRRHSEEEQSTETLIWLSDHGEEIALAQQERRLKETKLEGWKRCQSYRDRKPRKIMSWIVIWNLQG